jgi:hypothetical protein
MPSSCCSSVGAGLFVKIGKNECSMTSPPASLLPGWRKLMPPAWRRHVQIVICRLEAGRIKHRAVQRYV